MFWLGSDDQGRDMLSGIFYGLRISLGVGVVSTLIALLIGTTLGLVAAYVGGRRTETLDHARRRYPVELSRPFWSPLSFSPCSASQGVGKIVAALVTVQWAYFARTVRGSALVERRKEYVEAARCLALERWPDRVPASAAQLPCRR